MSRDFKFFLLILAILIFVFSVLTVGSAYAFKYATSTGLLADFVKLFEEAPKTNSDSKININVNTNSNSSPCINYKITQGEFKSSKCYAQQDYVDLNYYLGLYNAAQSFYNGATSNSKITCNGEELFKEACERDTINMQQAQQELNDYRVIINNIILKGH